MLKRNQGKSMTDEEKRKQQKQLAGEFMVMKKTAKGVESRPLTVVTLLTEDFWKDGERYDSPVGLIFQCYDANPDGEGYNDEVYRVHAYDPNADIKVGDEVVLVNPYATQYTPRGTRMIITNFKADDIKVIKKGEDNNGTN